MKRSITTAPLLALALTLAPAQVAAQQTADPKATRADYANPTDRYPHTIMGRLKAHTDLIVALAPCPDCDAAPDRLAIRLPSNLVFEDFAPRLIDLNRDGRPEIITVESDQNKGSRLAVWEVTQDAGRPKLVRGASTDFIGTRFRWLAPIGAADFDGDGTLDLAYVEKPHLDKILRIVRRDGPHLMPFASVSGVTNHIIGQEQVQSRIDVCSGVPTIFALDESGQHILSVQLTAGTLQVTGIGATARLHHLDDRAVCTP